MSDTLTDRIDALLPQTQCTRCGYPACRPYAEALATGEAPIDRCPPGGAAGIAALAALLERPVLPLDPACGEEGPLAVAVVDESVCIGCTKCILACPVDAIAGANRRLHTVIPELCTGCGLCVPPCPVDCIDMVVPQPPRDWTRAEADAARTRLHARRARLAREAADNDARLAAKAAAKLRALDEQPLDAVLAPRADLGDERRRALVQAALERAQARLAARARPGDGT